MAPLVGDQAVVGEWDPAARLFTVRGWVPGPAGAAAVDLGAGVEIEIDVAAPEVLTSLTVEAPWTGDPRALHDRAVRLLEGLLGPDRLRDMFALADADADEPIVRPLGRRDASTWRGREEERGVDHRIVRVALAGVHAETDADPLARAAARLDAVIGRAGLGQPYSSRQRARRAAQDALARLGELHDLQTASAAGARALAELVVRAGRLADDEVAARRIVQRVRASAREHVASAYGMPAPTAGRPLPALRAVLPVEDCSPAGLPGHVAVHGARRGDSELEVRAVEGVGVMDGWWARAHDPDGTPLAIAPLLADGPDAVARLLVPPACLRSAVLDVTDAPAVPRPNGRRVAFDLALDAGRAAARLERTGRPGDARARWADCAALHEQAGDETRAGQAGDRAGGGRLRQRGSRPGARGPVRLRSDVVGVES